MKLVFATSNRGKLEEASEILGPGFELLTPSDLGISEEIPETGASLKENSIQKASYIHSRTGLDCFADDTGLEVDCLGGAPGVRTARYAGEHCQFEENIDKLLRDMEAATDRRACFRCVITLFYGGEMHFFEGCMPGSIACERLGTRGFGYDPVFIPDCFGGKTLAQISLEDKDSISHRGQALREMAAFLRTIR